MTEVLNRELAEIVPKLDPLKLFTGGDAAVTPILAYVRKEIDNFNADVSTPEGRDAIKAFAYRVTRSKTFLDDMGKALNDKQKEIPKQIDATRKLLRDTLDKWKDEVRAPLTFWEAEEQKRTDSIKAVLGELQALITDTQERTSAVMRDRLGEVEGDTYTEEFFGEYLGAAIELRGSAIARLKERIAIAAKREADAVELAELRALKAKDEAAEREDRIRQEGVKAAEAKAAQTLTDERERAAQREAQLKREAKEATDRANAAVEAAAKRRADEQAARAADVEHRAKVNRDALNALVMAGIDEKTAKKVLELIIRGNVPRVSLEY